ncbi:MAG TPA: c-type cytochrome [Acidimicrobiales bacterium]|nr:c-type cytochrome [Acidimicrobiales bacterium]
MTTETPRRPALARLAAPAALVGAVAIFGLVAFSSGPASADTTTAPGASTGTVPGAQPGTVQQTPTAVTAVPSPTAAAAATSPANETGIYYTDLPNSFIAPGQALFAANCSSCHGAEANGKIGVGPNLQGLGAGTVDFWVSTGRMPLAALTVQATRKPPRFNRIQTLEIAAWVQSLTPGQGTKVPVVHTASADLEAGNTLFTLNCAACHTISGAGDALAEGAFAPSLHLATPTQVVEAIRSGPGNMPRFGPGNITNTEARDIAAYVTGVLQHPNNAGGAGLGGIGPVGEGFVGLLIGVGVLMLVCFWIGDRA